MTIQQVFEHYRKWEDWINGMYRTPQDDDEEAKYAAHARELLSDEAALGSAMLATVSAWPIAAAVNLSNFGINRRAWLGQSACCFVFGCPESCTRLAWNTLDTDTKYAANAAATRVIKQWERDYKRDVLCQSEQLGLTF